MAHRSDRGRHWNRPHVLNVEALEDRRLLSGAALLGALPLILPPTLSPTTSALTATLGSVALGGPAAGATSEVSLASSLSVRASAGAGLGDAELAGLLLSVDVEIGLGGPGLSVNGGAELDAGADAGHPVGGGLGLQLSVNANPSTGGGNSLKPVVSADLGLGGSFDVPLGDTGGPGPQLAVDAGLGLGGSANVLLRDTGGAGPRLAVDAVFGPGGAGPRLGDDSGRNVEAGADFLGFTPGQGAERVDPMPSGDSEQQAAEELLQLDRLVFQTTLLFGVRAGAVGDETLGVAGPQVPPRAGVVQAVEADSGTSVLDEAGLAPDSAGLLWGGAPFDVLSLERILQDYLDALREVGDELAGLSAGLGLPAWVFLVLAVAAGAGEVARRNLWRSQNTPVIDAVFGAVPQG